MDRSQTHRARVLDQELAVGRRHCKISDSVSQVMLYLHPILIHGDCSIVHLVIQRIDGLQIR